MTWVSERHLVAAISNAGGFGVLACGAMTPDLLATEIEATKAKTKKPFGVNLIVMHPDLDALIDVCNQHQVGHIGPVATSVLAQEILPYMSEHRPDLPIFIAGGIGHGEAVAAYLNMGASGIQMGTLFVCATESVAHPNFKRAFIRGHARDAMPSVQIDPEFKVIPVRALANEATKAFTQTQIDVIARYREGEMTFEEASLAIEHFWAGALKRAAIDGDVETGSLMAGQSVGLVVKEQPVAEIIGELVDQASLALSRGVDPASPFGEAVACGEAVA